MAKNLKVTIDSEEFRNSFRPHMPPSRASTEEPIQKEALKSEVSKLKRSSCWPGGTEGQYEDRVVRLEDISMGINPTLDYSSVPSTMEVKAGAVTTN